MSTALIMETEPTQDFEKSFSAKEKRLPKSVRTHIRELKREGKLDEAVRFARIHKEKKEQRLYNMKQVHDMAIATIVDSDEPIEIARAAIELQWIESSALKEDFKQRGARIEEVFDLNPDLTRELARMLPQIRDEISHLPLV